MRYLRRVNRRAARAAEGDGEGAHQDRFVVERVHARAAVERDLGFLFATTRDASEAPAMIKPERAARPPYFEIFAPGLAHETKVEFATLWAEGKRGTEPSEPDIAVLWNLLRDFPADEHRRSFLPAPLHAVFGEWRPFLEGRPGWRFGMQEEE